MEALFLPSSSETEALTPWQWDILISTLVAFAIILLTGIYQTSQTRNRHKAALRTEISSMPFVDLYNAIVAKENPNLEIEKLKELMIEPISFTDNEIRNHLRGKKYRYYLRYVKNYESEFPTSVYKGIIGEVAFKDEKIRAVIDYYNHVLEGELRLGQDNLREHAKGIPNSTVNQESDMSEIINMKEVYTLIKIHADRGASLQKAAIIAMDGDWPDDIRMTEIASLAPPTTSTTADATESSVTTDVNEPTEVSDRDEDLHPEKQD